MNKRTIYFGNPAYLSSRLNQLVVSFPNKEKQHISIPIEDIGFVILDHQQITITASGLMDLIDNKVAVVQCNKKHLPVSMHLPFQGHTQQTERFILQTKISKPLKKNLWKQVVEQKIRNQANLLAKTGEDIAPLLKFAAHVQSGDSTNQEAVAAAYYWRYLFSESLEFKRERHGDSPNDLLNYGYAILRAIVARAIVSSGLHPTLGIHHKSKYNAYCLADDLMEPYRIFVDELVLELLDEGIGEEGLTKSVKKEFLQLPSKDVHIDGKTRVLMNAVTQTTSSLVKCFQGELRGLSLPKYE